MVSTCPTEWSTCKVVWVMPWSRVRSCSRARRVAVAAGINEDVRGEGGLPGGDLPDVQVVDLGHGGDAAS